jgi:hypothetical protein
MTRYLSGLCVAGLGLCGGGWLVVAALAFGGESAGRAGRVNLVTGAVLIAVGGLSLVCWSRAWRQRLRADGVLADRFPPVSRREARRNRRALSRDVRRAAKLAERSARGARRAARRSARLASGSALSEGGVLGEGVALGVASPGDEQFAAAAPYGGGPHVSAVNGSAANGSAVNGASLSKASAGADPGDRAAELIGELRSMLEPLLAATGGQPVLAEQLAPLVGQRPAAGQPAHAAQTAASSPPPPPLPVRSPFASDLRPRARTAPMSIPRLTQTVGRSELGPASDGEDAWW